MRHDGVERLHQLARAPPRVLRRCEWCVQLLAVHTHTNVHARANMSGIFQFIESLRALVCCEVTLRFIIDVVCQIGAAAAGRLTYTSLLMCHVKLERQLQEGYPAFHD